MFITPGTLILMKTCSSIDSCEHFELRLKTLCDLYGYALVIDIRHISTQLTYTTEIVNPGDI